MAYYEHLPIYQKALGLCVYLEKVVCHFSRYHKYNAGADLRKLSRRNVILKLFEVPGLLLRFLPTTCRLRRLRLP